MRRIAGNLLVRISGRLTGKRKLIQGRASRVIRISNAVPL